MTTKSRRSLPGTCAICGSVMVGIGTTKGEWYCRPCWEVVTQDQTTTNATENTILPASAPCYTTRL